MTKHIAGIVLFTFIVGSSAFIAGLFYSIPDTNAVTVKENFSIYKKKKKRKKRHHCRKYNRDVNAKANLSQAVFNSESSMLTAFIDYQDDWNSYGDVDLHFFVNDKYGTRFLKTERIFVSSEVNKYSKTLDWMGRLDSRENLYVIPEVRNDEFDVWSSPTFTEYEAIPILLKMD